MDDAHLQMYRQTVPIDGMRIGESHHAQTTGIQKHAEDMAALDALRDEICETCAHFKTPAMCFLAMRIGMAAQADIMVDDDTADREGAKLVFLDRLLRDTQDINNKMVLQGLDSALKSLLLLEAAAHPDRTRPYAV